MGLFDWLGPTSLTKRRGWDALPSTKSYPYIDDYRAVIRVPTLVHGPIDDAVEHDANSAVYACLNAIATAASEPPLRVYRTTNGDRTELEDTPLGTLLERPNPHMTISALIAYLSHCLHIDGNAYWRKLRSGNPETGNVVELWPVSPSRIEIRTEKGSGDYVSDYRFHVGPGRHEDISPTNMIHFRMSLDDGDHRRGLSPLKRLLREISSDERATRYADVLLNHLSIPGLVAEFDKDAPNMTQAQADELKARLQYLYGGDNAGSVGVGSPGMKLSQLGFSPEQMDLKVLHRVPEERIAAVLGVPAIVAGLGAGLDRSTYSNFSEAREAFTEMKLLPFWRQIADTITLSLVPDFMSERGVDVAFDIDDVRALQDDQDAKAVRLATYVNAGIITIDEARAEIGHEPMPQQERPAPTPLRVVDADEMADQAERMMEARSRRLAIKAASDLPAGFGRIRDAAEPDWQTALETYLAAQLRRMNARLRAGADTAEGLIAEGEAALLGEALTPLQLALFDDVSALVVAELGVQFQLDDAATREYLRSAGSQIGGITQTTREAVRAALIEGQANGEGIDKLAARLRELPAFNRARAITVARTELGHATNTAAAANYRASGVVVGVRVYDGDYDAECAAMNGRTFPLNALPPTLQHPRCLRAFAPITDPAEMTRTA